MNYLSLALITTSLIAGAVQAHAANLSKAKKMAAAGAYIQCLNETKGATEPDALYQRGYCEYKLQRFQDAAKTLRDARRSGARNNELSFILGQSLYALQDFRAALPEFQNSFELAFKPHASLYYVGYIQNILDQDDDALKTFQKLVKMPDNDMKQAAGFQIAELYVEKAETEKRPEKVEKLLRKRAIPVYEACIAVDEKSLLAEQARARIAEIESKTEARPSVARPKQPWMVRFALDLKYDTNVINEPEGRIIKVSSASSPLAKGALFSKYEHVFFERLAVTPELGIDSSVHFRRRTPDVYTNDNSNLNPALRLRLDHKVMNRPASGLLEYEFSWQIRDYLARMEQMYYSRTHNFIAGERLMFTDLGDTTFKANFKLSENVNKTLSFFAPGVSVGQNIILFKKHVANATAGFENQKARDPLYDQRNYRLNLSYGIPQLIWQTNLDVFVATTFAHIVNQVENRGLEKNIAPGLTLTKYFDREGRFAANINYIYTKNISRDEVSYAYSKHVVGVGTSYTF